MTDNQIIECQNCGAKNRVDEANRSKAVCGRCKKTLALTGFPITITDANFTEEVEKSKLPVLIDFWATWCPPCKMLAPTIDQLAKDLSGKIKVGKLDVDKNQMTSARFGVQSIPTMLIFNKGREAERLVGVQSKEKILQRLRQHI